MGESSNNTIDFEAILQKHNNRKPIALYKEPGLISSLPSKVLKPQDVLRAVSNQLKDIQKADCLKKHEINGRRIGNSRNEFVPINVLYSQEVFQCPEVNKFETQCVTDTQLIDIVDSVEAMVNVDNGMSQEFQIISNQKLSNLEKNIEEESSNVCMINDNIGTNNNKQLFNQNPNNKEEFYLDDINTEVCKEFDTSYSTNADDTIIKINTEIANEEQDKRNSHDVNETDAIFNSVTFTHIENGSGENNDGDSSSAKSEKAVDISTEARCYKICKAVTRERDKPFENNNMINVEGTSHFEDNFNTNLDSKSESHFVESDIQKSPVFKSIKPNIKVSSPTHLTFPLQSFEKFESIVMPLIDENFNLEAVKHLINSQIIDNQLFIPAHTDPVLRSATDDLIFKLEKRNPMNETSVDIASNKEDTPMVVTNAVDESKNSFEDEILFSSDEDNDYNRNGVEELPMTCVMKTSFCESPVALEETKFVGFQTSSNKCIQVCKDSFIKAQSIFNSVNEEKNANVTLTELVDIYETKNSTFNNNLPLNCGSDKDYSNNKERISNAECFSNVEMKDHHKQIAKTEFIGFKTATGKSIDVSDKALLKSKTVFKDLEENVANIFNDNHVSNTTDKKREYVGFKTASNKKIKLSFESLAKTDNIFKDFNLNIPLEIQNETKYIEQENVLPLLDKKNTHGLDLIAVNNNDIVIHNVNLVDQTLLQEFENESLDGCANNKYHVGDSNLSKNFDPGISEHDIPYIENTSKFGFKTANNKEIKISIEALEKTKDLFNDIGLEHLKGQQSNIDINDKFNHQIGTVTRDANVMKDELYKPDNDKPPIFEGFRTAANRTVKISEEALLKSKRLFQDIDQINNTNNFLPTKRKENSSDVVNFPHLNKKGESSFSFQGFKTASNKPFLLSEEALTKSAKVFHDIDMLNDISLKDASHACDLGSKKVLDSNKHNNKLEKPATLLQFKPLKVSEQPHLNTKSFYNDSESISRREDRNFDVVPGFQGFKTASNKVVIVSEESLSKTRKIFQNIDDISNNNNYYNLPLKTNQSPLVSIKNTTECTNKKELYPDSVENKHLILENTLANTKHILNDVDFVTNTSRNKDNDGKNSDMETVNNNIDKQKNNVAGFKGFQTASNRRVNISEEALARSRKIFDDVKFDVQMLSVSKDCFINEYNTNKENIDNTFENGKVPVVFGFKTATNKSIKISEDALRKSKQLLLDLKDNVRNTNNVIKEVEAKNVQGTETKNNMNIENIINTQVLNNFEETLHTEDFYNEITPKQCKRSGSPILSCPKARKRKKFEAPYRSDASIVNIHEVISKPKETSSLKYIFNETYKKAKLFSLKDIHKMDESVESARVVDPYILNFEFDTLLKFEFKGRRNDFTHVRWTTDNIKTCFVESVNKKIIPEGWLDNHLKLILWKLISYETRFPNAMTGVCSVKNVLEQLKYRYDKELYRVERPALRKVLERDDISSRTMVLTVVGVYFDGDKVHSITNPSANVELLVTDGWYCVKATTDRMITRLVMEGKIVAGRKIATAGAELLNCEQGVSPWEDTTSVRLKLHGNSTRPARWPARLGYAAGGTLAHLSAIDPAGGKVCHTRAFVARAYPLLYVEKLEDGNTVTRSERLEHIYQMKHESERQAQLEKLYEEVEKEFFDQESSGSEGLDVEMRRSHQSGSDLHGCMKRSYDTSQYRSHLTESQAKLQQEYSNRRKEKLVEELQRRVQDEMRKRGLNVARNVVPLLKIRVASFEGVEEGGVSKAMISIWRPSDSIQDVVKEGAWVDIFNVVPTAVRNSEIQISAGRQSLFHRSKYKDTANVKPCIASLKRKCFTTKELNMDPTMVINFNEIDTVGIVFLTEPTLNDFKTNGHQFQNVYLTDIHKNFICINFWGGIKKFGYENIFETGNIVACMNLQKRAGNTRKSIPQYRATELTVFTKTPKFDDVRKNIDELYRSISGWDVKKFCADCVSIKNNYTNIRQSTEFSPYRLNSSDHNLTRNKIFIDSPLAQNKDVKINLTGLDFESTFKQTETQELSPVILKRKQIVKEKIARLKMYGEPPPLSKIHIINQSKNAGSAYKSPLTVDASVARMKNLESPITTNKFIQSSPILSVNRTYVVRPGVHPVKLNFSSTSGDERMESNPFEEEFEASPPLSLD